MADHSSEPEPQPEPPSLSPPAPPPPPARRRASGALIASVIVGAVFFFTTGLAVGLILGGEQASSPSRSSDSSQETTLAEAREACAPNSSRIDLGDDGHTLMIERAWAQENPGASNNQVVCLFDELGVPDSVVSRIEGTRALDGTQEADFGDYSAFWTFHPDDGLNMTITLES